ncbi:pentapeptide repeat-containing protein [Komarekiella sp. 'clone 1']|jgi:hypothetical protein|uniref:Pentapeptide repeat-containing protein n=1 Tax=Komarekiella delphini-convector SJRDD-AB1 TaxID=2593771 RepID=A0AA40SU80_9NOST|nr:pentapeptide repeat-containing protein [Komarekiella delphini-convector]MBD6615070.1 pentapeptide repeat-containing protein [Komarekiella delphini-convector SJRDD-AB1]
MDVNLKKRLNKVWQKTVTRWKNFQSPTKERLNQVRERAGEMWKNQKLWIISGSTILIVYTGTCIFYAQKSNNPTLIKQTPQNVLKLRQTLAKIYRENDPFVREFTLQQEAKNNKESVNNYRELLKIYPRNKEFLPQYPVHKWSILAWYYWLFEEVTLAKRNELLINGFLAVIEKGALITVALTLGRWLWEAPQRRKQELYQALQVTHIILGKPIQDTKINALETLNRDKVSLRGLTAEKQNLEYINLQNAQLQDANLRGANLRRANLRRANLRRANLRGANLDGANLREVNLDGADLREADLDGADLRGATNLTIDQVKSAYWEAAMYDKDFRQQLD